MKIFLTIIACAFFTFLSAQKEAKLHGTITNPDSDSVFLILYDFVDGKQIQTVMASSVLKDGKFNMKVAIKESLQVTFTNKNENCMVLLSPGDDLTLTLNTRFFDETIQFSGKGADKNNAVMTLYMVNEVMNERLFSRMDEPDTIEIFAIFDKDYDAYIALVNDYIANADGFESYGKQITESAENNKKQIKAYVASEIEFANKMDFIEGKLAIDFEGVDLNGKKIKLSDFKGKMIIVDFWATWCGPCKAEFPAYKELEEKYGKEINFVSVGVYCGEEAWKKMATDEGFKNNIFLSKEAEAQLSSYIVNSIPRYLVIDENFNLVNARADRPSSGKLPGYWKK